MGKGGAKVEVTDYYLSEHFGICTGPLDALLGVIVKEKEAWSGLLADEGSIAINLPELFGGNKKEGGLRGVVTYLPGEADQLLPDFLAQKLGRTNGADCPGFRGLSSLFFTGSQGAGAGDIFGTIFSAKLGIGFAGFYWTSNTPYLPGVWAKVRRILKRADGTEQWYPEKAEIGAAAGTAIVLPKHSSGWKYLTEVWSVTGSNYSSPAYDDSGWSTGAAPFYKGSPHPTPTVNAWGYGSGTAMASNYGVWMRRTITVTPGSLLTIQAAHDNDVRVWVDGTPVVMVPIANQWSSQGTITTSAATVTVVVHVRETEAPDGGNYTFADVEVSESTSTGDMNPAHIIHECLTDTTWGMGSPVAALDEDSFTEAADTLYTEGFGLSMMWTRQATIEKFVQEVLDHIQAVLFVDPSTGLLTLKLIRGDYDVETLPIVNPDNADLTSFNRKLWGDIVNEIVVTWTNPANEQEETITAQDLASIAIQGGPISDGRNYYGVRRAALAQDLAFRDLRSAGQPLATCEAEVDRSQWRLRPASVLKLTWPEYGLDELVMRVTSIDYGRPGDPTIKLSLIEDVYGLDIGSYDTPPATEWEDPSSFPAPLEPVEIITLPLFFAANSLVAAFVDTPEYPEVLAGVLATTEDSDTFEYELWDEVTLSNGSTQWTSLGSRNIIGRGELGELLPMEASSTTVTFDNIGGQTFPTISGFVIIGEDGEEGNEIAMIEAIDADTGEHTLTRGVLDTVPREWPAATPVWFIDDSTLLEDPRVRSSGEVVDYKLLTRTSQGLLDLESAPLESYTLTDRPWLPNRPANVQVYGEAWSSEAVPIDATTRPDPWVTTTWANRNRLLEDSQVLAWTDANVTPETGQTTRIEVVAADGTALTTHDGLTGTTFDVPNASFGGEALVRLQFYADRSDADGDFASLQFFEHWVQVEPAVATLDSTAITFDSTTRTMDED